MNDVCFSLDATDMLLKMQSLKVVDFLISIARIRIGFRGQRKVSTD